VYTDLPVWTNVKDTPYLPEDYYDTDYVELMTKPYPMFKDGSLEDWDRDMLEFMLDPQTDQIFRTPYFQDVVQPISLVWWEHKKTRNGLRYLDSIKATDWKMACGIWLKEKEA
jgi:hypothetical protein